MKEDIVKVSLGEWNYNAGIMGLYNVLKWAGKDILAFSEEYARVHSDTDSTYSLYFPLSYLENYSEDYYGYLIEKYFKQLGYGKIVGFKEEAIEYSKISEEKISEKSLNKLNDYIKNVLNYYMKSSSYKAAFELIPDSVQAINMAKAIKPITIKKTEQLVEKKIEVQVIARKIIDLINVLEGQEYRKYLGGKNIIYNILKRNWDGVSVLNKQVKEKDIYREINNYFVNPAIEYIRADKEKFSYSCSACGAKMKNLENSLSFLTNTGFDTARKTSYVWDFQNDIAICDFCKLVYMSIPCAFNYGGNKGIFINSSFNIYSLINVNKKLKNDFFKGIDEAEQSNSYKSIVKSINENRKTGVDYSLEDVQVVFYENERYRFSILGHNILKIIKSCEGNFKELGNCFLKENRANHYLYEETFKKLLNNQNLFLWINKLIHFFVGKNEDCYFNMYHVYQILTINLEFLKGVNLVSDLGRESINDMRKVGWHVREAYKSKDAVKKLDGITYKLLNALKTGNSSEFSDALIRCFLYIGKEIPKATIEHLENTEKLKTLGYAFVIGLNGASKKDEDNKEEKNA